MQANDKLTINKRTYTVKSIYQFNDPNCTRVELETKSGKCVTAMFFKGAFDVWDNPTKSRKSKFTRVNMRG